MFVFVFHPHSTSLPCADSHVCNPCLQGSICSSSCPEKAALCYFHLPFSHLRILLAFPRDCTAVDGDLHSSNLACSHVASTAATCVWQSICLVFAGSCSSSRTIHSITTFHSSLSWSLLTRFAFSTIRFLQMSACRHHHRDACPRFVPRAASDSITSKCN